MSVHRRRDGRWYVKVYVEKGVYRTVYFGRGEEARKAAQAYDLEVKAAKKKGIYFGSVERETLDEDPTFEELAARWLARPDLAAGTRQAAECALRRHVLPRVGSLSWREFTPAMLARLAERIRPGFRTQASCNRCLTYVRAILGWAAKKAFLIPYNPTAGFVMPHEPAPRTESFTREELARFLAAAPDHLRWACEVAWHTFTRPGPSELFALRWEDFDWERGGVWVRREKTGTRDFVPCKREFMEEARRRWESRDCEYVVSWRGRPVKSLKRSWRTALRRAGITKRLRFYDLRHFYVTCLADQGVDAKVIARLAGHASLHTTLKHYRHVADRAAREAMERLPALPVTERVGEDR